MAEFLGARIETPVTFGWDTTKRATDTQDLEQVETGGTAQRWRMTYTITDEWGSGKLGARWQAHRLRYGYGDPFGIPLPQHMGIVVPTGSRSVSGSRSVGQDSVLANSSGIEEGTFIQFSGQTRIYFVEAVSGRALTLSPELKAAVGSGTRIIVADPMTLRAKHAREQPPEITYEDGVVVQITFTVVESHA